MSKITYPSDWAGASSVGLIVNYTELTRLCVANGLDAGNIAFVADRMCMSAMSNINLILESKKLAQPRQADGEDGLWHVEPYRHCNNCDNDFEPAYFDKGLLREHAERRHQRALSALKQQEPKA